jgi:Leucine-rich repeat (LRR) protein
LICGLVVGVACGWFIKERMQSGFEEHLANQLKDEGLEVVIGSPYDVLYFRATREPQGWWREEAPQILGSRILSVSSFDVHRVQPWGRKDMSSLATLTNLQRLMIEGSNVSDLAPLRRLTTLIVLSCSGPVSDLTPLVGLTKLQYADLSGTYVADLTPLAGLTNLQQLRLDHTRVGDLAPLAGLTNLQKLWLSHTRVSDLRPLAGLSPGSRI